jgi:hypothetical protein
MDDPIDPRAAKLLSDLLALTLSDNSAQADTALQAIRRRAARDSVTAGALKQLTQNLLGAGGIPREVSDLRIALASQRRDLEETRQAYHKAETSLSETQRINRVLASSNGILRRERRDGWLMGVLLGFCIAGLGFGAYSFATGGQTRGPVRFDRVSRAQIADYLRGCYLSSSNSLVGTPIALHLLIDVDADGRITGARLAADQQGLGDADEQLYGTMMVRTLTGGSCGSLPLPASLRGRASELDLHLPR